MTLVLPSRKAKEGKPVAAQLLLENKSSYSECVNSRLLVNSSSQPHEISFESTRAGTEVPFVPDIRVRPDSTEFILMSPGAVIGKTVDLRRYFELVRGKYKIRARYQNHDTPPYGSPAQQAWKGEIKSGAVLFEIS